MSFAAVEPFKIPRVDVLIDQHGKKFCGVENVFAICFQVRDVDRVLVEDVVDEAKVT